MTDRDGAGAVVQRVDVPLQHAAVVRGKVTAEAFDSFFERATRVVADRLAKRGSVRAGAPLARIGRRDGQLEVEVGYLVDPPMAPEEDPTGEVRPVQIGGGSVVTVLHVGAHSEVDRAYQAARAWMSSHHLVPVGTPWEVFLDGPTTPLPRTAVYVPCTPELIPPQRRGSEAGS